PVKARLDQLTISGQQLIEVSLYPALTGSKSPVQRIEIKREPVRDQLPVKARLDQLTISG
ncbi:hypothetical protein JOC94_004351, partial [Bacillus thermophilus]